LPGRVLPLIVQERVDLLLRFQHGLAVPLGQPLGKPLGIALFSERLSLLFP